MSDDENDDFPDVTFTIFTDNDDVSPIRVVQHTASAKIARVHRSNQLGNDDLLEIPLILVNTSNDLLRHRLARVQRLRLARSTMEEFFTFDPSELREQGHAEVFPGETPLQLTYFDPDAMGESCGIGDIKVVTVPSTAVHSGTSTIREIKHCGYADDGFVAFATECHMQGTASKFVKVAVILKEEEGIQDVVTLPGTFHAFRESCERVPEVRDGTRDWSIDFLCPFPQWEWASGPDAPEQTPTIDVIFSWSEAAGDPSVPDPNHEPLQASLAAQPVGLAVGGTG